MSAYQVNRPDAAAMERALADNPQNSAGIILRLAWRAGLLREEISTLTWSQVSFLDGTIRVSGRAVPMERELQEELRRLYDLRNSCSDRVVLSDRDHAPLRPQSISRLARLALDSVGQSRVRLIDLRHDYVLRQLQDHDWQYVSRVTGDKAAALRAHFAEYTEAQAVSTRIQREEPAQIDEFLLWTLLQEERNTAAGMALWLSWQAGLQLDEIAALRWQQVDLRHGRLRLPDRLLPLSDAVARVLHDRRMADPTAEYVVHGRRGDRPLDRTRVSRLARAALVRGGLDDLALRDLRVDCSVRTGGESQILEYIKERGSIARNELMLLQGISRSTAHARLKRLEARHKVTRVGIRYYREGDVVPAERQAQAILDYLRKEGFAYRQDIARLLRIESQQCGPILRRMVAEGKIVQDHQRYLPAPESN